MIKVCIILIKMPVSFYRVLGRFDAHAKTRAKERKVAHARQHPSSVRVATHVAPAKIPSRTR